MAVLALGACGEPSRAPEVLPAWRVALTESPVVVRPYSPAALSSLGADNRASMRADGAQVIATTNQNGGWAAMLLLGAEAQDAKPTAIRVAVKVNRGALHFLSTYDHPPEGYDPYKVTVEAGDARVIYLPIDKAGPPLLVVANANGSGGSEGAITAIELVAPPASGN
ncbi:MAG: hypothetical protein JNJ73_11615 [Hyphomonadaceae bacterium]|nr:hypothetical protein [Hyphomonadaceae bacterium]